MWYDKRTMTALFYIGAMLTLVGVGLWKLEYTAPGIILTIIGVSSVVLGFWGIRANTMIEKRFRERQRRH